MLAALSGLNGGWLQLSIPTLTEATLVCGAKKGKCVVGFVLPFVQSDFRRRKRTRSGAFLTIQQLHQDTPTFVTT